MYLLKVYLICNSTLQAKGLGYAMNTAGALKFVKDVAAATGIILDPVYRCNTFHMFDLLKYL
jgi:1-aminocyclopropane-1-carboxylate deaminase/D-cysteine desulfhydrase-like pyridoxal-dependent ACC family enzyme